MGLEQGTVEQSHKAVLLSCYQTITQVHERLRITNGSISCTQSAGMEESSTDNYLQCNHILDWLPCPLVMRVSHRVACGSHAAVSAVLTIRRMSHR